MPLFRTLYQQQEIQEKRNRTIKRIIWIATSIAIIVFLGVIVYISR